MATLDPVELNIQGVQQLIGSKVNKLNTGTESVEGIDSELEDDFTLDMTDEELLALKDLWEMNYKIYEGRIKPRQQANRTYYLGQQKEGGPQSEDGRPISSNLLFEASETFYPAALAKNPEPVVWSDNSAEGTKLATDVKTMLQYHADTLVLRRKLTLMTRNWSIDFLGVIKHGWDSEIEDIKSEVRDVKNFIFDPKGYVDPFGDYIGPLGERITITAQRLIDLFPKHKAYITVVCDGHLGTDVTYTEWWNDDYCFYTFKDKVLEKNKNPHFNYDKDIQAIEADGTPAIDDTGASVMTKEKGNNHFGKPKKPYTFLSVFSFGEQPHDVTGLIEQNIPNQRRITRRTEQIDFNLSRANNSDIFSENNFNQETAKQAANAIAKGHPVLVPQGGPIDGAIKRLQAQGIDAAYFTSLQTDKQDLRSIYGVEGITSQPGNEDTTARGMILNQQFDNTRIGGGIGDALEQVADNVFNWWVQLYAVYYDVPHFAAVMGQMKAVEYITLKSQDMNMRLVISVSPDSMKPHDEITEMNQAMSLFEAGALDPKTLLTMLNVPDAQKTAEMTVLWKLDPQAYMQINFPEVAQQLAQIQQAAAQQQMANEAQGAGQKAQAEAGASPPVEGQQPPTLSVPPAGANLNQVPLIA